MPEELTLKGVIIVTCYMAMIALLVLAGKLRRDEERETERLEELERSKNTAQVIDFRSRSKSTKTQSHSIN